MPDRIDHVVFDIGKVLIHYDPTVPYARLIPDAKERDWFLETVCSPDWNIEQDRGRSWDDAEELLIADYPDHAGNIRAFRKHWGEMITHHYADSVSILRQLIADGRDVTMLTNFASDTFREARARFDFLSETRGVTVSADVGLLKPDRAIYARHAQDFDLTPSATLFIDDTAANVEGAENAGWNAVRFVDAPTLKADLQRYGVLD